MVMADALQPPRERFLLGNMVPLGKSSVLYGPTGAGKSAALAQIAFGLAAGEASLWGMPLLPGGGPVLVYTTEDSLDDWKRKASAIRQAGDVNVEAALDRLYIIDRTEGLARLSEVVTVREGSQISTTRRRAEPTEEREQLISAAKEVGAILVVVETASRLVEEEDNAEFSALQSALGHIGRETGAGVLVSHHVTKAASREGDPSIESARGGGAFVNNARNALSLYPATGDDEVAKPYVGKFPLEDLFILGHQKSTSSTRRQAPIVLARCGTDAGAVFRLPGEAFISPEHAAATEERVKRERARQYHRLEALHRVVARELPAMRSLSANKLRDFHADFGAARNEVGRLVGLAKTHGVLVVTRETKRGEDLGLGVMPDRETFLAMAAEAAGRPSKF